MRAAIESKAFGAEQVLGNITLSLAPGSFTALTGPSGCGKTTLLRILAGLDRDWRGHLEGAGRVACVFQEPRLLPWRSVLDNVRLAAEAAGRAAEAGDMLSAVGLAGHADSFPRTLSTGMARRAALARALAVRPDVLLMDEPFVSLDDAAAQELRALTLELWRETRPAVLMVTHNLAEAAAMADRIMALSGRPASVIADLALDRPHGLRDPGWIAGVSDRLADTLAKGRRLGMDKPSSPL